MRARKKIVILLILAVSCIEPCLPQYRNRAKTKPAVRRAAFLAYAASYEETPSVTKVTFKNGMKALVQESRTRPLISIRSYINGGLSDETEKNEGLATLLAGMIARGDSNRKTGTFRQKIHALGGTFDLQTGLNYTLLETVTPSAQWKQALTAQMDALFRPGFEKDAIKLEADLLSSEAMDYQEDPGVRLNEILLASAFKQPRFLKYDSLSRNNLAAVTPERLKNFHKIRYIPSEITLVVTGDVRAGEVLDALVKMLDAVDSHPSSPVRTEIDATQKELNYRMIYGDVAKPRIVFGFHTSSPKSKDYPAVEVLHALLAQGEGAILNARLRDQKQLMHSISGKLQSIADAGYLSLEMETEPANIDQCAIAFITEIELIKRDGPAQPDLRRAMARLESLYWTNMETVSGRGSMLAQFEASGDWKQMRDYVSDLYKVKAEDVQKAAERYLKLSNCTLIELLPQSMKDRNMTADGIRKTLEGLALPSADQEKQDRIKEVVLAVNYPEPGPPFKPSELHYPFQVASILRGPSIFIQEDHSSPLLEMGIFYLGGKSKETPGNGGVTELMLQLMMRGNPEKQGSRLQRQLEIYGGALRPVVTDDYCGFNFTILSKNFAPGFTLLQEILKTPTFDPSELERLKKLQEAKRLSLQNTPFALKQKVTAALFNDFSYARDSLGSLESIRKINVEEVKNCYNEVVHNRKPVVVIVGDTQGTSLASFFVRQFSGSRMLDFKPEEEYAQALEKAVSLEQNHQLPNSYILHAFHAPPKGDEDAYTTMVLQNYLGEQGRLLQEVRDRQGLAFRISFQYAPRLRGGSLSLHAGVNRRNEDNVLKAFGEEIRKLVEERLPPYEFQSALASAEGMRMMQNQARADAIADLAAFAFAGKTLEEYEGIPDSIRNVKEEDLQELAARLLKTEGSVLFRVHGSR